MHPQWNLRGRKVIRNLAQLAFNTFFAPKGRVQGQTHIDFSVSYLSQYVWRTHDRNSVLSVISDDGGVIRNG